MIDKKDYLFNFIQMLDGNGESDTLSQDDSGFQDDIDKDPSTHLLQLLLLQNQQVGQIMVEAIVIVAEAVIAAAKKHSASSTTHLS